MDTVYKKQKGVTIFLIDFKNSNWFKSKMLIFNIDTSGNQQIPLKCKR